MKSSVWILFFSCPEEERSCVQKLLLVAGKGSRWVGVTGDPAGESLEYISSKGWRPPRLAPSSQRGQFPLCFSLYRDPCPIPVLASFLLPPIPRFRWRSRKKGESPFHYRGRRWRVEERDTGVVDTSSWRLNGVIRTSLNRWLGVLGSVVERELAQESVTSLLGLALSPSTLDKSLNLRVSISKHSFTQNHVLYVLAL